MACSSSHAQRFTLTITQYTRTTEGHTSPLVLRLTVRHGKKATIPSVTKCLLQIAVYLRPPVQSIRFRRRLHELGAYIVQKTRLILNERLRRVAISHPIAKPQGRNSDVNSGRIVGLGPGKSTSKLKTFRPHKPAPSVSHGAILALSTRDKLLSGHRRTGRWFLNICGGKTRRPGRASL